MFRSRLTVVVGLVQLWVAGAVALAQPATAPPPVGSRVDAVFQPFAGRETPGCAVSVAKGGKTVLSRAYGMANLEYSVPITADTIFEAGSVSKQFTAAAIGLLVEDGKLSLDDDVRKYVPELPDFGTPIRVGHLLTHTSGLRSQWVLLSLAGRPPGEVVHTTAEILDLVRRQRRLNFDPGDDYLYSNTGYTLLGVIVQRVSGTSLAAFTTERLFGPLGMTRTSWRDDHTRIVKDRATAYTRARDGTFRTAMPFTNVHGNGGLLTNVGDLQKWNANLDDPRVGGAGLVQFLEARGRLNDGFEIAYARGLQTIDYRGIREISHGGATAGYRAFLARFPDERVSVAILCNVSTADAASLAHGVAEAYLDRQPRSLEAQVEVPAEQLAGKAGLYRNLATDAVIRVAMNTTHLALGAANGDPLVPLGAGRFRVGEGFARVVFEPDGPGAPARIILEGAGARPVVFERVDQAEPEVAALAEYAGAYHSDEIDTTYSLSVKDGGLWLAHRWLAPVRLRAAYADAFEAGEGRLLRFTRDGTGTIDGVSVYAGRVRHLRFERQ
jgi:CubicO group peptidase (beta-lactamase class C family)